MHVGSRGVAPVGWAPAINNLLSIFWPMSQYFFYGGGGGGGLPHGGIYVFNSNRSERSNHYDRLG